MTNPCKHGSLPRFCEICERDVEIEQLKHDIDFLRHCTSGLVFISEEGQMKTYICATCGKREWVLDGEE